MLTPRLLPLLALALAGCVAPQQEAVQTPGTVFVREGQSAYQPVRAYPLAAASQLPYTPQPDALPFETIATPVPRVAAGYAPATVTAVAPAPVAVSSQGTGFILGGGTGPAAAARAPVIQPAYSSATVASRELPPAAAWPVQPAAVAQSRGMDFTLDGPGATTASRADYGRATVTTQDLRPPAPAYSSAYVQTAAPALRTSTGNFVLGGEPVRTTELPAGARMTYGPGTTTTLDLTGMPANYAAPAVVAPVPAAPVLTTPAYTSTGNFIQGGGASRTIVPAVASAPALMTTPAAVQYSGGVRLFLPPFHNATADEHAGRAMTEVAATALLERGINLVQTEEALARSRLENAAGRDGLYLETARAIQATHLLIGTVHEYRYKTDLDGSPAVGITVRLVSAADGATIWQGSTTKSSRFFSSLSRVALGAAREMAAKVPLDVVRR